MQDNFLEKEMETVKQSIDPESFRFKVLESSSRFKDGWVDLAKKLTKILGENLYREWGYTSFEQYCRLEIRIKKNTALKLTGAWQFYQHEISGQGQTQEEPPKDQIPELEAIGMLQKAKESHQWPSDMYEELKNNALEQSVPINGLRKQFNDFNKLLGETKEENLSEQITRSAVQLRKLLRKYGDAPLAFFETLEEIEAFVQNSRSPRPE